MESINKERNINNLPIKLSFQDEARFGRMSQPRSCWAQYTSRPIINLALVRQFRYIYATVSPWDGKLIYTVSEQMNTFNMNVHLSVISKKIRKRFLIMIVDGAASH